MLPYLSLRNYSSYLRKTRDRKRDTYCARIVHPWTLFNFPEIGEGTSHAAGRAIPVPGNTRRLAVDADRDLRVRSFAPSPGLSNGSSSFRFLESLNLTSVLQHPDFLPKQPPGRAAARAEIQDPGVYVITFSW